jgi:hypothetical protein
MTYILNEIVVWKYPSRGKNFKSILMEVFPVESYEASPESKDTKVLNMHKIFNLQKRHCERIASI